MRLGMVVAVGAALSIGLVPIARAAEVASPYPGGRNWSPPAATYGVGVDRDLSVKVDDGTKLAVDVSYPTDTTGTRLPGPFPVILNQDLYAGSYPTTLENATGTAAPPGEYFAQRGFIFVHLHDRGTGGSQGVEDAEMGPRIGLDGAEIAYWAARHVPGSNGAVGLEGCSALGFIQLPTLAALGALQREGASVYVPGRTADDPGTSLRATAANNPIKAAIPACLAADLFREQFSDNGIPSSFTWTLSAAQPVTQAALIGLSTSDPSSNVANTGQFADMMAGGDYGYYRQFWRDRDSVRNAPDVARTGAAILMWPGWGESGFMAAESMYSSLQNAFAGRPIAGPMTVGQKVTPRYQMLIGNWGHGGGLDNGIELEWFQTWMLGIDTGLQRTTTPMHMWEMAPSGVAGRWVNAASLPATENDTALYLDAAGTLTSAPPASTGSDTMVWGAGPQLTYQLTKPFDSAMTLIGPRALRLWISSSNTNAQIYAELEDVAPGPTGAVTAITHGSMLASRSQTDPGRSWIARNGLPSQPYLTLDQDRYVTPGQPIELDIPLQEVTWRVEAGHTLQLKLAPNAGAACTVDTTSRQGGAPVFNAPVGCLLSAPMVQSLTGGTYQILHGPGQLSVLDLPLVPSDSIPTAASAATPTSGGVALPQNWSS
jgi:predicted acyl esterase